MRLGIGREAYALVVEKLSSRITKIDLAAGVLGSHIIESLFHMEEAIICVIVSYSVRTLQIVIYISDMMEVIIIT